eukprot:TRINITY_DN90984_c0_g1_i1.p1 TRINITY_DN90984_c0_g1~~TRINITY_DN90984_c0_g1_i1.p1  ORF type:complete len:257 (-),score=69.27 TRINITY_DN90984_c0_g1_i1:32-802(-)
MQLVASRRSPCRKKCSTSRKAQSIHKLKMQQQNANADHQLRMLKESNANKLALAGEVSSAVKTAAICSAAGQGLAALGQFGSACAMSRMPHGGMHGGMPGIGGAPHMAALGGAAHGGGMAEMMMPALMGAAGGAAAASHVSPASGQAAVALTDSPFAASTPRTWTSMMALEDSAGAAESTMKARKHEMAKKRGLERVEEAKKKARGKSAALQAAERRAAAAGAASSSSIPTAETVRPAFIEEVDDDIEPGVYPADD